MTAALAPPCLPEGFRVLMEDETLRVSHAPGDPGLRGIQQGAWRRSLGGGDLPVTCGAAHG